MIQLQDSFLLKKVNWVWLSSFPKHDQGGEDRQDIKLL